MVDYPRDPVLVREIRIAQLERRATAHLPLFDDAPPIGSIEEGMARLLRAMARGVYYCRSRKKWRAMLRAPVGTRRKIGTRKNRRHLGWFANEMDAIRTALSWSPVVDDSSKKKRIFVGHNWDCSPVLGSENASFRCF